VAEVSKSHSRCDTDITGARNSNPHPQNPLRRSTYFDLTSKKTRAHLELPERDPHLLPQ
jgi:hypothetical protein